MTDESGHPHPTHPGMLQVTSFRIAIPSADLDELSRRLTATRWPGAIDHDWADGTDLGWLQSICRYWARDYDWRRHETELNALPQYLATVDGQGLHFVHQRSPHARARPLLLIHGWPGSFVEFRHMIAPLTDPVAHGGRAEDAFHVVAPSLPGYGFSPAPDRHGCNGRRCAELFRDLMQGLGYTDYFAQGGDWGAHVATWLGALDPACAGLHLNLVFARKPRTDPFKDVTEAERMRLEQSRARTHNGLGYQEIQSTRPQSLGYALNDSPAGLAGWILEKFHGWSDHDGDPEQAISRDDMLTNVALYWFTGSITASMRLYYENRQHPPDPAEPGYVSTPTAVAAFPGELYLPPPAWIARAYNLVHYRLQHRGGHFAALEAPELLIADIREALRPLRHAAPDD